MEIINVVEIVNGILTSIESFPMDNDGRPKTQIEKAEALFKSKAVLLGCENVKDALVRGGYDDNNGYDVLITWSSVNE